MAKMSASFVKLDVTNKETITEAMKHAALAFGGVDIIVNNAGISISKPIADHTIEDWDKLYDIISKRTISGVTGRYRSDAQTRIWRRYY